MPAPVPSAFRFAFHDAFHVTLRIVLRPPAPPLLHHFVLSIRKLLAVLAVPKHTHTRKSIRPCRRKLPHERSSKTLTRDCDEQSNPIQSDQVADIPESGVSRESLKDAVKSFGNALYVDFSFGSREAWLR